MSTTTSDIASLHVLRVEEGLGNACLLILPDGSVGVVDWGTQHDDAFATFDDVASGRHIRFIVATHAHQDHTLGLPRLLDHCAANGIEVDRFVYPASTLNRSAAHLTKARERAYALRIPMSAVAVDTFSPGQRPPYLAWADDRSWEVRVLSPSDTRTGKSEMSALAQAIVPGNETSIVVLFRFMDSPDDDGIGRAILPGDATPMTLKFARETAARLDRPESFASQAFVVPHHGSSNNLPRWLDPLVAGLALVSSPSDSEHHPSPTVLERLAARTCASDPCTLYCTSYARACRETFGGAAPFAVARPGPCFGDIEVAVPRDAPARAKATSDGERRRPFGYCGDARATT